MLESARPHSANMAHRSLQRSQLETRQPVGGYRGLDSRLSYPCIMTAFVDLMYPHPSIVVPPHLSRANIAPKSKYTYPSSAQSIDTLTYPPKQITITYPEITHPRVHHVSADINLDSERYIPIRYDPKFPPRRYPSKPYCIGELIPI
jgi:hypothetical protein